MAAKRDYYQILGVDRSATPDQIKHAYRMKAVKLHPDQNRATNAVERFSEVKEAFGVLSDVRSRTFYDRHGVAEPGLHRARTEGVLDDLFSPELEGTSAESPANRERGGDVCVRLKNRRDEITQTDARAIVYSRLVVCASCRGEGGRSMAPCSACRGTGETLLRKGFDAAHLRCDQCNGKASRPRELCTTCAGRGLVPRRTRLPLTIADGGDARLLRVEAAGDEIVRGIPGDLYVLFASSNSSDGRDE